MRPIVLYLLIITFISSTSIPDSFWTISKHFEYYTNLDTLITNKLFTLHNEKHNDIDLLRYICDQHRIFLSRNKFTSQPVLHNKISNRKTWIDFEKKATEIDIYFRLFLRMIESCEMLNFSDFFVNVFISLTVERAEVFFNSIKSTENLLYQSRSMMIRSKCSLTSESMNWESLHQKIEITLIRTYILTKFALMFLSIKRKDNSLMWTEGLRAIMRNLEKSNYSNFYNQTMNREDEGIKRCILNNSATNKWSHPLNTQVYVSLRDATSDIEQNMFVVGFRFLKQLNQNVFHLQIRQAKLNAAGGIIAETDHWKPVKLLSIHNTKEEVDYIKMVNPCSLLPTDIRREFPFIVTGLRFSKVFDNIVLMARFNELDVDEGTVSNITDDWQYEFGIENRITCIADCNLPPLLDKREIFSEPLKPLSGVGISRLRSKSVVSPKIFTIL